MPPASPRNVAVETYYYGRRSVLMGHRSKCSCSTAIFALTFDLDVGVALSDAAKYDNDPCTRVKMKNIIQFAQNVTLEADRWTESTDRSLYLVNFAR